MAHPLDNEDVRVTLALTHVPTGTSVTFTEVAPCDADPTVSDLISQLGQRAKDALLQELESH